jgi:hypothetical protein
MDFSFLTTTFCFIILIAQRARFVVTIIGSISGVMPTATLREKSKASTHDPLVSPLIQNTSGTMMAMNRRST